MDRCKLNLRNIVLFLVIALAPSQPVLAQCGDECKVNTNLAMVINVPVSQTAQVASIGWGTVAGVGYNLNKQNALIGEFMWNRVSNSSGPSNRSRRRCHPSISPEILTSSLSQEITGSNCAASCSARISSAAEDGICVIPVFQPRSLRAPIPLVVRFGSGGDSPAAQEW